MEPENDYMGSLFEGMVLFTPPHMDTVSSNSDESKHLILGRQSSDGATDSSLSLPLDENLFSDLSLIVAPTTPENPQPPSPSSVTVSQPQISGSTSNRKKKRATGLRIGYGRDRDGPAPQFTNANDHHPDDELKVAAAIPEKEEHADSDHRTISTTTAAKDSSGAGDQIDNTHLAPEVADSAASFSSSSSSHGDIQPEENKRVVVVVVNTTSNSSRTIEFRFEEIKASMAEKLKNARESVSSISAARKDSIRKRRKAAQHLNQASAKYRELEKELEEACETEEFEKAERVSESLASSEKERELLLVALRDAEADCDAVDFKMQEALESQIQAEEEFACLLQRLALDASNDADFVLENAEALSLREMEEWLSSTEEVELKKLELEIESHLIHEVRLALNNSIEHSVEEDQREREILYKRREILSEELEKLLALVKEKEAEIAENNFDIETVEKRIGGVVSNFEDVHSGLDAKHNNLQLDLRQLNLEHAFLFNKKKKIDDDICQEEARVAKIREISRISTDEANLCQEVVELRKSLVQFILKFMEDKMRLAKTEQQLTEDVNMLRLGISAARASLQELSLSKSSIQQEVESFKQRLLFIDKRVPELEAEKKVAATARNFKEAARIATEAKTLGVEREGLGIKLEDATLQLQKLEEQIFNTVNRLEETESQVLSKEKELEMARYQRLILIAEAAIAERSAALELGDLEEADILLAEADAAATEARKLQPLYNIRDEDTGNLPKRFIPMELVSKHGGKQLAELVASIQGSAC